MWVCFRGVQSFGYGDVSEQRDSRLSDFHGQVLISSRTPFPIHILAIRVLASAVVGCFSASEFLNVDDLLKIARGVW